MCKGFRINGPDNDPKCLNRGSQHCAGKKRFTCIHCGAWFLSDGTAHFCSDRCLNREKNEIVAKLAALDNGELSVLSFTELVNRAKKCIDQVSESRIDKALCDANMKK